MRGSHEQSAHGTSCDIVHNIIDLMKSQAYVMKKVGFSVRKRGYYMKQTEIDQNLESV